MIKVAVIGVGSMGCNHARIYSEMEDVELVAVADPRREVAQKVAERCRARAYVDYREMLNNEDLDAVSIAVPTSLHWEVGLCALGKGIHVLMEKPLASSEQEANELIECAKKNQAKLMVGHIERFNPAVSELKSRLEKGELGEIYKIDVQRIGPFPSRITDVGVITDLSVHDLDIIDYLINDQPERIYAETQQKLHPGSEDSVTALIKDRQGVLAVLNINYLSPTKTRQLKIFGKKGMFKVDYLDQGLFFYENKGYSQDNWNSVSEGYMMKINIPKKEPLQAEIESFLDSIKKDLEPSIPGEHGLKVLKIANLLALSAAEKKIIGLQR